MHTDKANVINLFGQPRRYLVPLFQRGYVWEQNPQWETLWRDLKERAEIINQSTGGAVRKHFLGAVVLHNLPDRMRRAPTSEVIDGQQRLTTLQLLLAAFRDVVGEIGEVEQDGTPANAFLVAELTRLTDNGGSYSDANDRYKVSPTNAYVDDFRAAMSSGSSVRLEQLYPATWYRGKLRPPRPPMIAAYLYFSQQIRRFVQGQGDDVSEGGSDQIALLLDRDRAELLYHTLANYLQLVTIELEGDDDPQVIFETLNANGVPLGPADLVRNFVFIQAARNEHDASRLFDTYWKIFDESTVPTTARFWTAQERHGRFKRSRLDLFFWHYLTMRTSRDIKLDHLFQEWRDWWSKAPRDIESELRLIRHVGEVFRTLINPDGSTPWGVTAKRLKVLDTSTLYPFLLWLEEHRGVLGDAEFSGILRDLESYVVRRAVCNLTTKAYNRLFRQVLEKLSRGGGQPSRAALQRELLSLKGESVEWPNDDAFFRELTNSRLYDRLGPGKTQMILEALNAAQHNKRHEQVQITAPLTVEHILPQSATGGAALLDWPYAPVPEDTAQSDKWLRRYNLLHSLGNLTLTSGRLNASLSNGPFSSKRPALAKNSLLALNTYFQNFADSDVWDEDCIVVRGASLAQLALEVWPRPVAAQLA